MRKPKIISDYSFEPDLELSLRLDCVVAAMTSNGNFPQPTPSLATLAADSAAFKSMIVKVRMGDSRVVTEQKNELRAVVLNDLAILANYVQTTSEGNKAVMMSSGLAISSDPKPAGPFEPPTGLIVSATKNPGELRAIVDTIKRVKSYVWRYREQGVLEWQHEVTYKRTLELTGLKSGKKYEFCVAGAGSDPARNYCDVVVSDYVR